jgi:hypothetical protein
MGHGGNTRKYALADIKADMLVRAKAPPPIGGSSSTQPSRQGGPPSPPPHPSPNANGKRNKTMPATATATAPTAPTASTD